VFVFKHPGTVFIFEWGLSQEVHFCTFKSCKVSSEYPAFSKPV